MSRKKNNRRNEICLNCGNSLKIQDNYCPDCGQENKDNYVSIWKLLGEFLSNYFSLDSRFGRTWLPFIFHPGKITIEFNEGKRVRYANPIRWYLVISLVHFFLLSQISDTAEDPDEKAFKTTSSEDSTDISTDVLYDSSTTFGLTDAEFSRIISLSQVDSLGEKKILDSLNIRNKPFIARVTARQMIRLTKASVNDLNGYIIQKIPIVIFFLLPFYAFTLKLFYWRKGLYIKHLVHSIHLHSMLFFLFSIFWLVVLITTVKPDPLVFISLGIFTLYLLLSLRRVYNQTWPITILKLFGTGIVYSIFFFVIFTLGILVSLVFF